MIANLCWHTVPTHGSKRNIYLPFVCLAWHVVPNLSTICHIVEIISDADDWAFLPCISQEKKRKKQKGSFIWNYIALKHDTKLVLTYSPYIWLQKEYVKRCKYLQFVKLAEPMSLGTLHSDDGSVWRRRSRPKETGTTTLFCRLSSYVTQQWFSGRRSVLLARNTKHNSRSRVVFVYRPVTFYLSNCSF